MLLHISVLDKGTGKIKLKRNKYNTEILSQMFVFLYLECRKRGTDGEFKDFWWDNYESESCRPIAYTIHLSKQETVLCLYLAAFSYPNVDILVKKCHDQNWLLSLCFPSNGGRYTTNTK